MDWTRGHVIGHGSSGAVVSVAAGSGGDIFAVKSMELWRSQLLQRETSILSTMDSDHIIAYKGCDITVDHGAAATAVFNLKMEYAPRGSLALLAGGDITEPDVTLYTHQILKGLDYLHAKKIVHCDIKLSNILLTRMGAKIADFGCAKAAGVAEPEIRGTPMYMAPEVARGEEQESPADIWALGCSVIHMATGKSPWPDTPATLRQIAFSGKSPEIPSSLSEIGKDFLSKCLAVNPTERWTAKELLQHPFLDQVGIWTESPTSVLHRGVWGSVGEEYVDVDGPDCCPKQRMEELWMNSGREEWEWGDNWVTVRKGKYVNSVSIGRCRQQRD